MRQASGRFAATLVVMLLISGCTEAPTTAPVADVPAPQANVVGSCALVSGMTVDVRNYFSNPYHVAARKTMSDLSSACSAGNQAAVTTHARSLLVTVETVLRAGAGGDPTVGARLVESLFGCLDALCVSAHTIVQLAPAMADPYGLFAFRAAPLDMKTPTPPALARAKVPFGDTPETRNEAQWGVEVVNTAWWNERKWLLLYGRPLTPPNYSQRLPGAYDLRRYPTAANALMHVGVCFDEKDVVLTEQELEAKPSLNGRLRRNGSLIALYEPTFCNRHGSSQQLSASLVAPVIGMARTLLPTGWFMAAASLGVPGVGGSPLDFSIFDPQLTETAVQLKLGPVPSIVTAGQHFGPITVEAKANDDSPLHQVRVRLTVQNNSGTPAGAFIVNDIAYTDVNGVATFEAPTIDKTGGYTICAIADMNGYTFKTDCSPLFHVRK